MMDKTAAQAAKRRRLIYGGLGFIALGVFCAILEYLLDRHSDEARASYMAAFYLVMCTMLGLGCIGWAFLPPPGEDERDEIE